MLIGDRKIVAKIEEKQKAREQYDQAKSEGKRTSLLEQQRPNVFQMNVANIMPGDIVKVTLRYTKLLILKAARTNLFTLRLSVHDMEAKVMVAITMISLKHRIQNKASSRQPILTSTSPLSAGMPIQHVASTTHKITTAQPSSSVAQIALSAEEKKEVIVISSLSINLPATQLNQD